MIGCVCQGRRRGQKPPFPPPMLHWFESSGHFPMWDQPEETVAVILAATQ